MEVSDLRADRVLRSPSRRRHSHETGIEALDEDLADDVWEASLLRHTLGRQSKLSQNIHEKSGQITA